MYQPPHFRNDDLPQIRALMREQRFVTLISSGSLGLFATYLPTVTKDDAPYAMVDSTSRGRTRTGRTLPRSMRR
jgi:predicted FMN-binding regulatory protein PaiB